MGVAGFRGSEYSSIQNADVVDEPPQTTTLDFNNTEFAYKTLKSSVYSNMQKQIANSNGIQTRMAIKTFHFIPIKDKQTNLIVFNILSPSLTKNGTLDLYNERPGFTEIIDEIYMIEYLNPYDVELNFKLVDSKNNSDINIYVPGSKNKNYSNSISILIQNPNRINNLNECFVYQGSVFDSQLYKESDESSKQIIGLDYTYHIIGKSDEIYETIKTKHASNEKLPTSIGTPRESNNSSNNNDNILFLQQILNGHTKTDIVKKIANGYELFHENDIIYTLSKQIEPKVTNGTNGQIMNSISSQFSHSLTLDEDNHRGNFYLVSSAIAKYAKGLLSKKIENLNMKKFKTVEIRYIGDPTYDKKLQDQLKIHGYTFSSSEKPTEYYSIASPQSLVTFTLLIKLVSKEKVGIPVKTTFRFLDEDKNVLEGVEKNLDDEQLVL